MSNEKTASQVMKEINDAVTKMKDVFEKQVEYFDTVLALAIDSDMLEEFIESYGQLRDSGFDFDDAVRVACEELELEQSEEEDKKDD